MAAVSMAVDAPAEYVRHILSSVFEIFDCSRSLAAVQRYFRADYRGVHDSVELDLDGFVKALRAQLSRQTAPPELTWRSLVATAPE